MNISHGARKLALTAHITFSVGWLGAVAAYLALAVAGVSTADDQMARAAYLSMDVIARFVIVPFAIATVLAGLIESLGTPWGLLRHWWVLLKFVLTVLSSIILLNHLSAVTGMSGFAANMALSPTDFRDLRIQLVVHAAGGLLVLFGALLLSVYKPWGMTPYGLRTRRDHEASAQAPRPRTETSADMKLPSQRPRWVYIVGFHLAGLLLLFLIAHITGLHQMSH
jgi:hypothetical protein